MILFVAASAITFGGLALDGARRYLPFWLPAVVAFALSVGREPSIMFLALFLIPTVCMGVAAISRKISPLTFLILAASDVVLAVAVSIYQSKSALWSLPPVGGWGFGGGFAAGAAILKMGAPAAAADRGQGPLVSLGWWQGALLAYWAGAPAGIVLVAGGVALWLISGLFPRTTMASLALAGGTLAIAAGLGVGLAGLLVVGLAGAALAMGERVISTWTIGLLPLSLVSAGPVLPGGPYMVVAAVVFPMAWAVMAKRLTRVKSPEAQVRFLLSAAAVGACIWLTAAGVAFIPEVASGSLSLIGPLENGIWLMYGAGVAAMAGFAAIDPSAALADLEEEPVGASGEYSQYQLLVPGLIPPVAWLVVAVSVILAVRLVLAGLRTGFL
jgi:hypothetical protein